MKCDAARHLIATDAIDPLPERPHGRLVRHLEACPDCRRAHGEHRQLSDLLEAYRPPPLPDGFEARLRARLAAEPAPAAAYAAPSGRRPGRRLHLASLAAAAALGLLVGAALTYRAMAPQGDAPARRASSVHRAPARAVPQAHPVSVLTEGQVVILSLEIRGLRDDPRGRVEIQIPDGLAFTGPAGRLFPEKQLTVVRPLVAGSNRIRLAVRALRPGTWTVRARSRAAGSTQTATAEVRVRRAS